jgi:hypothetical protein
VPAGVSRAVPESFLGLLIEDIILNAILGANEGNIIFLCPLSNTGRGYVILTRDLP